MRFRATTAAERLAYCATGEPFDKAGGYGIQGHAAVFVEELEGSYSGVVGLPLFETAALLTRCGVGFLAHGAGGLMKREEILINATLDARSRAAVVESGVLQEVHIERASRVGLVSNIYKGKVSRVLPGMQAAFVESGSSARRSCTRRTSRAVRMPSPWPTSVEPDIREFVREGHELLVQVLKEPLGTKGARLTTYIAIPSRYLVLTPKSIGIGVSSRIDDEAERERLRCAVEELQGRGAGGAATSFARRPRARRARRCRRTCSSCTSSGQSIEETAARTPAGGLVVRGPAAAAARAARLVEPGHRARARRRRSRRTPSSRSSPRISCRGSRR